MAENKIGGIDLIFRHASLNSAKKERFKQDVRPRRIRKIVAIYPKEIEFELLEELLEEKKNVKGKEKK